MEALRILNGAGLNLRAEGDRLVVTPASLLTDPLRDLIRQHKAALLAEVQRRGSLAWRDECLARHVLAQTSSRSWLFEYAALHGREQADKLQAEMDRLTISQPAPMAHTA